MTGERNSAVSGEFASDPLRYKYQLDRAVLAVVIAEIVVFSYWGKFMWYKARYSAVCTGNIKGGTYNKNKHYSETVINCSK